MSGRIRGAVAPVVGAGSLLGPPMAWFAEHPLWAFAWFVVAMVGLLILNICVTRPILTDALKRGTSVDVSYPWLKIRLGRNTSKHDDQSDRGEA